VESSPPLLERGRTAFERRSWRDAHEALGAAAQASALGGGDLWRLALASYLVGEEEDFLQAMQAAHQAHLDAGERAAAVRCAFWMGLHLATRGEAAQATGWFGRAARLVEDEPEASVERGYLLLPSGQARFSNGDNEAAERIAAEALAVAQRFGDPDLLALSLHLRGRAVLRQGRIAEGLALLDEAMVTVTSDELSPVATGLVYCSVIGACREVWALGRVREWTAALARWCGRQPDMVAYRGECRVYQSEIFRLRGRWSDALSEARRASDDLSRGAPTLGVGLAHYARAEVHRLRGEFAAAEEAYHAASLNGHEPQPGLALLRLAQGDLSAAAAALRRALAETPRRLKRVMLLPARVHIEIQRGELDEARRACEELEEISSSCAGELLGAMVSEARGAIDLEAGDASSALGHLRQAWRAWRTLDAPHAAARVRVLVGRACRALGDEEGATLEFDAARMEFQRLGAAPDLAELEALRRSTRRDPHGLTPREREVLALVATGMTNRAVGRDLSISERTVARHLANIFRKLGLSSRAAATAYAHQHNLVDF
jgi:DNA-binding CsgD family transcriptional regulator